MWWRIVLAVAVILFLWPASYKTAWRFSKLAKFYRLLGFYGPLEPTREAVHVALGILSLPFCCLLAYLFGLHFVGEYLFHLFPFLESPTWCALAAALTCGIVKEMLDILASSRWRWVDSCVDVFFWLLGGLIGPLFWVYAI